MWTGKPVLDLDMKPVHPLWPWLHSHWSFRIVVNDISSYLINDKISYHAHFVTFSAISIIQTASFQIAPFSCLWMLPWLHVGSGSSSTLLTKTLHILPFCSHLIYEYVPWTRSKLSEPDMVLMWTCYTPVNSVQKKPDIKATTHVA